jgi:hypothetical protein
MPKTRWLHWSLFVAAFSACVLTAGVASAQRVVVVEEEDAARFRGGVSLSGGGLFLNSVGVGLVGVDGRLGVQINNLIAVYAQPYLAFGGGSGYTGTGGAGVLAGADAVVDFTFNSFFFVGAGGGAGAFVAGGEAASAENLLFRVGFYPIVARRARRARRTGLMVGVDIRPYFVDSLALFQAMGTIGFEAF